MKTRYKILLFAGVLLALTIAPISDHTYRACAEENEISKLTIELKIYLKASQYIKEYAQLIELQGDNFEPRRSPVVRQFCQDVEGIISLNPAYSSSKEGFIRSAMNDSINEAARSSDNNKKLYYLQSLLFSECLVFYNVTDRASISKLQQEVYGQLKKMDLLTLVSLLGTTEEKLRQLKLEAIQYTLSKNIAEYIQLKEKPYQDNKMVQVLNDIIADLKELEIIYQESGLDQELQRVQKLLNSLNN